MFKPEEDMVIGFVKCGRFCGEERLGYVLFLFRVALIRS